MAIRYRYMTAGGALALFLISVSLIPSGVIKFKRFPALEGNQLDARVLMPTGTPLHRTETVVVTLLDSLQQARAQLPPEPEGDLIQHTQIAYSVNADASEEWPHVATIRIATIEPMREFSRIIRVNHQRTVTISGDIDATLANTNAVINDTQNRFLPQLQSQYPELSISFEGEVKNSRETNTSILSSFILGVIGVGRMIVDALGGFRGRGIRVSCILIRPHFPMPYRSPTAQVNIKNLIDDVQFYRTIQGYTGLHGRVQY